MIWSSAGARVRPEDAAQNRACAQTRFAYRFGVILMFLLRTSAPLREKIKERSNHVRAQSRQSSVSFFGRAVESSSRRRSVRSGGARGIRMGQEAGNF